tara:strand:+ start:356 stop:571 length:216 start_codon:yes stop_codon:yes gene_type:complete
VRVGSLVEWIGGNGIAEEGYGIVLEVNDRHVKVYWLRIEDETHLSLTEGTVVYENDGADIQLNKVMEVTCS